MVDKYLLHVYDIKCYVYNFIWKFDAQNVFSF